MTIAVGKDRILELNRHHREVRQQAYEIDKYALNEGIDFPDSKNRRVYKNFNFSIFIDDFCQASCNFCVAELRYEQRHLAYKKEKFFDNQADYYRRLEEVLELIRPLDPSVSITGGEPTISPRFPEVVRMVNQMGFRKKVTTSNGGGLWRKMPGAKSSNIDVLLENKWDHLNISRAAFEENLNQELMKYKGGLKSLTYTKLEDIQRLHEYVKNEHLGVRMSAVLTKPGVNSTEAVKNYVRGFQELGANNFIFRELMRHDKDSVNQGIIEWSDANRVSLRDLWPQWDLDEEFSPVTSVLGYYYYVEVWNLLGATVASEAADLDVQYVEKDAHEDVVYEMVFHENGNLCGSWVESEDVLWKYEPTRINLLPLLG